MCTVPSGHPVSLRATSLTPREVRLVWSPPPTELTNGIITGYTVTITGVQSEESYTVETTTPLYSVTTLPYTSYMFTVSASTVVGAGPPSPEIAVETPEDGENTLYCVSTFNAMYIRIPANHPAFAGIIPGLFTESQHPGFCVCAYRKTERRLARQT